MKRRIVSLLMCLVMVLSLLPTEVWAEVLPEQGAAGQVAAENGGQEDGKESAANAAASQSGESGAAAQAGDVAEVDIYGAVTTYTDIFEAFAATKWKGAATVKLLQNVTLDDADDNGIELQNQTVTLDLNGKTISQKSGISVTGLNSAVFSVSYGADLTVMDSRGGGKIVQPNGCPAVAVWKNVLEGTLIVNGGTIENTSTEGHADILGTPNCAVYAKQGAVTINGGTLTGQKIGLGAYAATLTITGGQLHGESSNALLVGDSTVSLSGGTYTTNENDNHSIWCTSSEVENLLAVGYGFVDEKGDAAETTEPNEWGSGTVGKVIVKKTAATVSYIGADGTVQSCANYEVVTNDTSGLSERWYVVKENADVYTLYLNGYNSTINLILCDGATLTATYIDASGAPNTTLNIYLQSGGTGRLVCEDGVILPEELTAINRMGTPMKMLGRDGKPTSDLNNYFTLSKCTDHQWEYKNITDTTHDKLCALCGNGKTGAAHTAASYRQSSEADTHIAVCECGKEYSEACDIAYYANDDGKTHTAKCGECGKVGATANHDFRVLKTATDPVTSKEYPYYECMSCNATLKATYNGTPYTSLQMALDVAEKDGGTVKAETYVTEKITVTGGDVTIDLNGNVWYVQTAPCVPLTVDGGKVTLKNGVLRGGYVSGIGNAAIVNSGSLTLAEGFVVQGTGATAVKVNGGDLILNENVVLCGGLEVPADKTLADYLPDKTAFVTGEYDAVENHYYEGGYFVSDVFTINKYTGDMQVQSHPEHSYINGVCNCGVVCDHSAGWDESGSCKTCQCPAAAEVTGAAGTSYYISLPAALDAAKDGGTVKLLADHVTDWEAVDAGDESTLANVTKKLTLDLNGNAVDYLMVGNATYGEEDAESGTIDVTIASGSLTIKDSSTSADGSVAQVAFMSGTLNITGAIAEEIDCTAENSAENITGATKYGGKITISGGAVHALHVQENVTATVSGGSGHKGNWLCDSGTLTITGGEFSDVYFRNNGGTIAISGGTFGAITNKDASTTIPVMYLLKEGYAFYDKDGKVVDGSTDDKLRDVTVKPHTHSGSPCECGYVCTEHEFGTDGKCTVCGYVCLHESLDEETYICKTCGTQMAAKVTAGTVTTYTTDLTTAFNNAANGATITLLRDIDHSDRRAAVIGDGKTVTLNLNGHTISGGWISAADYDQYTTSTLKIVGSGSFLQTDGYGNLAARPGGTLDLSGWTGGTIDAVQISDDAELAEALRKQTSLIIGRDAGTINALYILEWQLGAEDMANAVSLSGGSYGKLYMNGKTADQVSLGDLLASGCAFRYMGENGAYVPYDTKLVSYAGGQGDINNVTVASDCPHPESEVTDATGSCAYCAAAFEAKKTDKDGKATYIEVGELNYSDFESGSVMLLRDVSKGILYCRVTATLDLNGHSLMASFTITGACTLKDSHPKANYIQSIAIGRDSDADAGSLIIEASTNVHVEKLTVRRSRNTKLAGGTFDSIIINEAAKSGYWAIDSAADLLAEGYAYATLQGVVNGYQDTLTGVSVVEHKHTFDSNYKCGCGLTCAHETYNSTTGRCTVCGKQMAASVNGQYYETFETALEALKGNGSSTLKLFDDCQYGETALNSNNLRYTSLTIDLNGHDLYGAESTSRLIQVIDGARLTIKDTSAAQNGSVDNIQIMLGVSSSGKLTLESGAIDILQVSPGSDIRLREGAKLRYLTTGGNQYAFPVAALFSFGFGLMDKDGSWADLGGISVGRATNDGYYTVKEVKDAGYVGGNSTSAETPAGRNTLPFDLQLVFLQGAGDVAQVKFRWYRADTNRDMLAGSAATPDRNGDFIYDKTTVGSGNGWTDLTTGKTANLVCVATGLDAAGNTLWCMSAGKYDLTIGKGDLSDARISFTGGNVSVFDPANDTKAHGITVTHNGKTLTEGKDYTVSGNTANQVGVYQLTITAVEGSSYVGEKSAEWTVRPYQLAPAVGDAIKQYDGTTDLPENTSITLVGADPDDSVYFGKTLPTTGDYYVVTNARYDSANAGTEEKTISFTVRLKDNNFIFNDATTRKEFTVKGSETTSTFKINKAASQDIRVTSALTITNNQAGTYEMTLPDLPALKSPCEYGDVSYSVKGNYLTSIYWDATLALAVVEENGQYKLRLTIDAVNSADAGSAGTVDIKITTANYQDITMTVGVKARNKLMPEGSPTLTPNAITYGQTVGIIALSGSMKAEGKTVAGTFTWDTPNAKPSKAGSYEAAWTFTPTDTAEYQVVHGTTAIAVNPAPLTDVSVRQATALTYNGQPQQAAVTTTGSTVDGTPVVFQYSTKSDGEFSEAVPQFTDAGTYTVYYQASDENQNHVVSNGKFTVTIAAKDISKADIVLGAELIYNGKQQTKAITSVTVDGLDVTYDVTGNKQTDAGKYQLTVTGTGNFIGTVTADYTIARKDITAAKIVLGDKLTYNGKEQTQTIKSVTVDGLDVTYTVSGDKQTDAGNYTLTITGNGNFTGTRTADYTIARKDISNAKIVLGEKLIYNGAEQTQSIDSVTVDGLDVTYTVSGDKNTKAGSYQLTVTGTGNFTGTAKADYSIADRDISKAEIKLGAALTYNGKEQTQTIESVKVDGLDVAYTVSGNKQTNAGKYILTITGTDGFTGTVKVNYTIATKDIGNAEIKLGDALTYNGKQQTQSIDSVRVDGLNVTYDVTGDKQTDAGKYQLTVTGNGNFTGTHTAEYTIARKDISKVEIKLGKELTYNGEEQTQIIDSVTVDGLKVTYTVSGDKNTDAGKYQLTIIGTGNFIGTATADYTIARKDITAAKIVLGDKLTYNGKEQTQTIKSVTVDGLDVTYTVTGDKNTKAGKYTLTITGTGNFIGTATAEYTIANRDISKAEIKLGASLTYNGKEQTQTIESVKVDGLDVAYTVTGNKATNAGKYTLTITGTNGFTGTVKVAYSIAAKDIGEANIVLGTELIYNGKQQTQSIDSVTVDGLTVTYDVTDNKQTDAGKYTLTVTGNGNFTGTRTVEYTIARKNISNAEIKLGKALTYNGEEQTQSIDSVTVDGLDVTYTVSGDKQTDAGKYTLTVTGTGNFTGTRTADYTIAQKDVTDAKIVLGAALTYNGKEQTQTIASVTVDGLDVTYDVTGDKATNAGDYTLTITANGNFVGTLTTDYAIAKKDIQDAVVDVESPVYTGKIQTPKINGVTVDDMTLIEGTDYAALTKDAVSAGSYAMKLIGMGNFTGAADRTFTILKAEALTVEPIRVDVTNDYAASYTVALRTALNSVLPEGCSFGTVNYGSPSISDPSGYCGNTAISQDVLTLAVAQVSSDTEGLVATVEIPVETGNYQQMTVTVELYAVNKLIPTGAPTPSKTTLNYGDTLDSIRLRGSMRCGGLKVPGTFTWAEPDLRPAAGQYEATWVFIPNDSRYATVTGTITITVKEPSQPTYKVGGIVKGFRVVDNEELAPVSGAVVTICKGLTVLGGRKLTDENGLFNLDGVLPGVYNVVVEYQGKTVTTKVELTDHDVELKVLLPKEDVNSELEIKNAGNLTRDAVVGGLDAEASLWFKDEGGTPDGGSVLVSLELREQPVDKSNEVQNAIRKAVKARELEFVDLTLTLVKNGVETTLTESGTVLEIILSCDTGRKIVIARQETDENGELTVKELTEADTGAEGTYYIDKENKQIHLFVNQLSTYAIGYYGTTGSGGGSGSTDASGTTPDDVKSANTGDIGLLPYAVMALSACTGVTVLRFRRKRED